MAQIRLLGIDQSTASELTTSGYEVTTEVMGRTPVLVIDLTQVSPEEAEEARKLWFTTPVVIYLVSEKITSEQLIKLYGFGKGHVVKSQTEPWVQVLLRLIEALLSLVNPSQFTSGEKIQLAEGITLDEKKRTLSVHGEDRTVTPTECDLAVVFHEHKGEVVEADTLIRRVWGGEIGVKDRNALRVHIHRLRNKIEPDPNKPIHITTARGFGYKLN